MIRKIILFLIITLSFINVNASTNTFERTQDNLLVPDYINVTDSNRSNILLTPAVDSKEKIYDFADLFTDSEEERLFDKVTQYIEASNLDMAIVTVSYNNKHSSQRYSDDFYDYNTFGIGSEHSGLLFLIDMDTREIYITTTGQAIRVYTDNRYNNILDNVFSFMSDARYYDGTERFINLALSYSKLDPSNDKGYTINENGNIVKDYSGIIIAFIVAIVIDIIALLIMISMNKMVHKACSSREYLRKDTKRLNKVNEVFLGSHVSKVRIDTDSGSSGGSSMHSGSSGISHGGGGHRF